MTSSRRFIVNSHIKNLDVQKYGSYSILDLKVKCGLELLDLTPEILRYYSIIYPGKILVVENPEGYKINGSVSHELPEYLRPKAKASEVTQEVKVPEVVAVVNATVDKDDTKVVQDVPAIEAEVVTDVTADVVIDTVKDETVTQEEEVVPLKSLYISIVNISDNIGDGNVAEKVEDLLTDEEVALIIQDLGIVTRATVKTTLVNKIVENIELIRSKISPKE